MTVRHVGQAPPSPALRPAQYVLTAGGTLHAAVGPGSTPDLMPAPTARLTRTQLQTIWRRAVEAGLDQPPAATDPAAPPKTGVVLTTALTAHGRTHRQTFALTDRPGARRLLQALAPLRGDPPAPGDPD